MVNSSSKTGNTILGISTVSTDTHFRNRDSNSPEILLLPQIPLKSMVFQSLQFHGIGFIKTFLETVLEK